MLKMAMHVPLPLIINYLIDLLHNYYEEIIHRVSYVILDSAVIYTNYLHHWYFYPKVGGLENPAYGTLGRFKSFKTSRVATDDAGDEVIANEAVNETMPENNEVVQGVDHYETDHVL